MAHDPAAAQPLPTTTAVESSRAWILGLVVEPDGSVSGPASVAVSDVLACECPFGCQVDHETV